MRLPLPSTVGCWTFGSRLPRSRRARESFVWGIALTFAAGACAAQEVTIAVSRASLSLPVWVADSLKLFANEGLPVTTRECVGGHRCIKLMLDGEVPLATAAEMPVMLNSLARSDFAIVATFVTSKRDIKLIARRSAGIKTASDLRGKRLGTVQGTSAHYFLDGLLLFNAIDPHGVELVPLAPEQIPAALSEGQIAAAASTPRPTTCWRPGRSSPSANRTSSRCSAPCRAPSASSANNRSRRRPS
jgi:ABC-type nitrate/sulfonate/bicarbonate transport system substrate-binding protein